MESSLRLNLLAFQLEVRSCSSDNERDSLPSLPLFPRALGLSSFLDRMYRQLLSYGRVYWPALLVK